MFSKDIGWWISLGYYFFDISCHLKQIIVRSTMENFFNETCVSTQIV